MTTSTIALDYERDAAEILRIGADAARRFASASEPQDLGFPGEPLPPYEPGPLSGAYGIEATCPTDGFNCEACEG